MAPSATRLRGFAPLQTVTSTLADGVMHWCVVTPDLDAALTRLETLLGVPGFLVVESAPLYDVTRHGRPIDLRVDMALGYLGDVTVEVIRPHDTGDGNMFREFLAAHPEGGIQHLGYTVPDFGAAHAELASRFGPAEMAGKSRIGSEFAYFDTRATTGLHTEILWLDDSARAAADALRTGDHARLGAF